MLFKPEVMGSWVDLQGAVSQELIIIFPVYHCPQLTLNLPMLPFLTISPVPDCSNLTSIQSISLRNMLVICSSAVNSRVKLEIIWDRSTTKFDSFSELLEKVTRMIADAIYLVSVKYKPSHKCDKFKNWV